MAMETRHYIKFTCSGDTFKSIRARMTELAWESGMTRGFLQLGDDVNLIRGALISERTFTLKKVFDPNKRTDDDENVTRLCRQRFTINQKRGILSVESRKDLKPVVDALDALPGIVFSTADFKLRIGDLLDDLQQNYLQHEISKLGVSDYIEPVASMIADVGFKMSDARESYRATRKYKDQLKSFLVMVKLAGGSGGLRCKVAVTAKGSLGFSDLATDDLKDYVEGMLQRFDAEGEDAEPAEKHGLGHDDKSLKAEREAAAGLLANAKDEKTKSLAQRVMDNLDAALESRGGDAGRVDDFTAKAVREMRKLAKKFNGLAITHNGKTVTIK